MKKSKIAEKSEKIISISKDIEKKTIPQIIDCVSSYIEDDKEICLDIKKNRWFITSFVLCKLNNWYTNDYLELNDIFYINESYQGAIVELVSTKNNSYKDITVLTYDKLFINIIDNLFDELEYSNIFFDLKSVFKYVYNYYLNIKNNGGYIDTCINNWLNYTWGILNNYKILDIDLSSLIISKVRNTSNLVIKMFNNDIIYFDTDTIWLKRLPSELIQFNEDNNLRVMEIKSVRNFIIFGKKKYIEIYNDNFMIRGIR